MNSTASARDYQPSAPLPRHPAWSDLVRICPQLLFVESRATRARFRGNTRWREFENLKREAIALLAACAELEPVFSEAIETAEIRLAEQMGL